MVGRDIHRLNVDCQWGTNGLRAIASGNIVVIVDVLSFSTATTVAVAHGAEILPCEWNDARAAELAKAQNAQLAAKRGQGRFSLAPASMKKIAKGTRLVLPSPNGSTLAQTAQRLDAAAVVIGCLRNATTVASWAAKQKRDVAIIAAGERWDDGTIRFAIEDWLGAGAIISRMVGNRSAEAESAAASFERLRYSIHRTLAECPSGRELIEAGYPDDIDLASEVDVDHVIPLLQGIAFKLAAL